MENNIPEKPKNALRVTLTLDARADRMDNILLEALRSNDNEKLKAISRAGLKELFNTGKVLIKGQRARPSSALAKGVTYVDIIL